MLHRMLGGGRDSCSIFCSLVCKQLAIKRLSYKLPWTALPKQNNKRRTKKPHPRTYKFLGLISKGIIGSKYHKAHRNSQVSNGNQQVQILYTLQIALVKHQNRLASNDSFSSRYTNKDAGIHRYPPKTEVHLFKKRCTKRAPGNSTLSLASNGDKKLWHGYSDPLLFPPPN